MFDNHIKNHIKEKYTAFSSLQVERVVVATHISEDATTLEISFVTFMIHAFMKTSRMLLQRVITSGLTKTMPTTMGHMKIMRRKIIFFILY